MTDRKKEYQCDIREVKEPDSDSFITAARNAQDNANDDDDDDDD